MTPSLVTLLVATITLISKTHGQMETVLVFQAEDATQIYNRTNVINWRSNAAGMRTVWLQNDYSWMYFHVCPSQDLEVQVQSVTFSSDGWEREVAVWLSGPTVNMFFTSNNSDGGNNWNTFHTNYGPYGSGNWTAGRNTFGVQLMKSSFEDPTGVEIDQLSVRFSGNDTVTREDLTCP